MIRLRKQYILNFIARKLNNYGKNIPDDPISVWTEKVIASFEKVSEVKKELSTDFKESLGRLSFFRQPLVTK